ncbi:MAG: hypothetical protein GQ574_16830 [Crocinitomix sp.]|nr:hypothetical protein [Crocinitomix sp.]
MKQFLFLFIALSFLTSAVVLSFYFEDALYFSVLNLNLGWVLSSILIRFLVMLLVIFSLLLIFKSFNKTKSILLWITIPIGMVLGFFVSFAISPIYDIDYGILNDQLKLETFADLSVDTDETYRHSEGYEVIAFLDVGCAHCKMALKKLNANVAAGQIIPIHLFFHNDSSDVLNFLDKSNSADLTHHHLKSEGLFIEHAGFEFPSIFLINPQGETIYHWVGDEMNYSALDYLLSLEQ